VPVVVTARTPERKLDYALPVVGSGDTAETSKGARIKVRVPAEDAQVWFDDVLMKQGGLDRRFVTPALEKGSVYTIEVRASWRDAAGNQRTQTRRLDVRAGSQQTLEFPTPP
jgi:uncharacterized protein (TIGR03000 family)